MTIPTYADRIAAKFGEELTRIRDSINTAILTGCQLYHNNDYYYYSARVGFGWPDNELRSWLEKEYKEAGWGLDFVWANPHSEDGDCLVEIYAHKGN